MSLKFTQVDSENFEKIIIFIHGWKGNKDSFKSLSSIINIPKTKWYFPQAPYEMDISLNQFSWSFQNPDGSYEVEETVQKFNIFLKNDILSKIDSKKVFFIGFSQGATICYELILQMKYPWGGVFPVAGFKRDKNSFFTINKSQINTPIIIGHGIKDDVIPISSSEVIFKELKQKHNNVFLEKFNGGHKISINYLKKIQEIIHKY